MRHWLLKTEPDEFGWPDQVSAGDAGAEWTGIRNYQARNNLRSMAIGDLAFFYHSNIGKEIVGIVEITRLAAQDSSTDDARWSSVWVRAVAPLQPVTLERCKQEPDLKAMVLLNNSRLSVQPVTPDEWAHICALGGFV
ncbi:MAG: EVE domain-containing protein [Cypionkella sp.]|nr:EVE domain-containing protein [Cypionkella sp.]